MPAKTFGECIAEARAHRGWSQPVLLKKLGGTTKYPGKISEHENSRKLPELRTIENYANALEIILSYRKETGWSWRPN